MAKVIVISQDADDMEPTPPRPRGRPRAEVQSTALTTWVPVTMHDRLIQRAKRHDVSVSSLVKQILAGQLRKP